MADEKPTFELGDLAKSLAKLSPQGDFSSLAAVLASMASPPAIQKRWFKDETLYVDGYTFEDCRFDSCTLITEFATFKFQRCFIGSSCRLYFRGAALKTVQLLMH